MHGSTGKLPEGVIASSTARRSYGIFDECINIRGPEMPNTTDGSTSFDGKYCSIFFNLEIIQPDELMDMNPIPYQLMRDNLLSYVTHQYTSYILT